MIKHFLPLLALIVIAGCSTPPRPPQCTGDNKRPVNPQTKVDQKKVGIVINPASYTNCAA